MIRVLDEATIDKIAAGEVVERPASVVKELVENAVDAGARAITVECRDGGIEWIRITDDGCGIPSEEVRTAFLRHATSKIRDASDLSALSSLGFRGEALSSICAVSRVEIITKTPDALIGVRMEIEGGKETGFSEVGAPNGTTILVRNLFYNTPARRKFLKTPNTEGSAITDVMERIALSHPEIAFQVTVNGKSRFHTSGNAQLKDAIYQIYGREIAFSLVPFQAEKNGIRIRGFLGKPELVRSNRSFEIYYINGRYVISDLIAKSIEEGYREYLMLHRFPVCFLLFTIDPHAVDVNVHPTKQEVRIQDSNLFYATVSEAIHEALRSREMLPEHVLESKAERKEREKDAINEVRSGKNPEPFETERRSSAVREESTYRAPVGAAVTADDFFRETTAEKAPFEPAPPAKDLFAPDERIPAKNGITFSAPAEKPKQQNLFEDKILTKEHRKDFRIIGQVFETYWLIQYERKLMIIDQHAAHEKVNYERMVKAYREKAVCSQSLLPPVIVTLSSSEEDLYLKHADAFAAIGFEIEHMGGSEYALRAVPTDLYGQSEGTLFLRILEELSDGNARGSYKVIEEKIAGMACKASVKGGDKLTLQEAERLIDELLTLENPYNCPHGRPTIIVMTETELEKKFKRIVED
ncbi:MAG: DNA mismatch repair endonuclease MutL [Lachnospiraceae bacterium]|nr:DNA mismatch repair endonuclease MutL [Lachnospiraceae bacterium]